MKKEFAENRKGVTFAESVKDAEVKVKALEAVTRDVLNWSKVSKLESVSEYESCAKILVNLKEQINEAEKERKTIVDPLNGVVKHVNQRFKPYVLARQDLEYHLKALIKDYLEEQRAILVKAAEKEAKAAEKKGAKQLAMDIRDRASIAVPVPGNAAVAFRKRWTFKVTDEKKIPREYLCVDEKAITAAIAAGERDIAGVEIFEDTIVAVSA